MDYQGFIVSKSQVGGDHGFDPTFIPDGTFDFQSHLIEWACRKGRSAIFADCGLGKTLMQLAWAENVVRHTNGRVLIATPLAVSHQTVEEAEKFGIEAKRSSGTIDSRIVVTNYERLHHFDRNDFVGMVCDESSILKNYDGTRRGEITEFSKRMPYRLLCTATAAPNDYIELGTSSEALGEMGYMDMLGRFFKNNDGNAIKVFRTGLRGKKHSEAQAEGLKWRFKGHAREAFWRWVSSWAKAMRKPSDLGFDNGDFDLPDLSEATQIVRARTLADGFLFDLPAQGLDEQREERKRTIEERCGKVADLVNDSHDFALVWCQANAEGDLLEKIIPDAIQVSGADSDEAKEEKLTSFAHGKARVLITKPKIGAWGLNFQHCAHLTYFPSHSYEQYYQSIRRCWRFGQKRPVRVDVVATEGDGDVMKNMRRKAVAADAMFAALTEHMRDAMAISRRVEGYDKQEEVPSWL